MERGCKRLEGSLYASPIVLMLSIVLVVEMPHAMRTIAGSMYLIVGALLALNDKLLCDKLFEQLQWDVPTDIAPLFISEEHARVFPPLYLFVCSPHRRFTLLDDIGREWSSASIRLLESSLFLQENSPRVFR